MSSEEHTPGPWFWEPGKRSWQGSIEPDICDFGDDTTYYPTEGTPPNEANARLIAAAPDLLAALEWYALGPDFIRVDHALEREKMARAAIAKAKGGDT